MTTEERINIIKNRAKKDTDAQIAAENEKTKEINRLKDVIREMSDQIKMVLTLANTCVENGIKIPEDSINYPSYDSGKQYGYPHEFIAEGIRHHTGLIRTWPYYKKGTYEYIGINNGGACGCYDFWTDGNNIWSVHEGDRKDKGIPRIKDMNKFIEEFPVFANAFLTWIDSLDK